MQLRAANGLHSASAGYSFFVRTEPVADNALAPPTAALYTVLVKGMRYRMSEHLFIDLGLLQTDTDNQCYQKFREIGTWRQEITEQWMGTASRFGGRRFLV